MVLDTVQIKIKIFFIINTRNKIKLGIFDIRDQKKLEKFILKSKPSIIFHLAAQPLIIESLLKTSFFNRLQVRRTN